MVHSGRPRINYWGHKILCSHESDTKCCYRMKALVLVHILKYQQTNPFRLERGHGWHVLSDNIGTLPPPCCPHTEGTPASKGYLILALVGMDFITITKLIANLNSKPSITLLKVASGYPYPMNKTHWASQFDFRSSSTWFSHHQAHATFRSYSLPSSYHVFPCCPPVHPIKLNNKLLTQTGNPTESDSDHGLAIT